jgi:hypothetical protein
MFSKLGPEAGTKLVSDIAAHFAVQRGIRFDDPEAIRVVVLDAITLIRAVEAELYPQPPGGRLLNETKPTSCPGRPV